MRGLKRRRSSMVFLAALALGMALPVFATDLPEELRSTDPLDKDEFLGQISMAYLQSGFQDRVDEFSGYLHVNAVDIRLPGHAGMEIVVQRYYSSNVWNRVDNYNGLARLATSVDPGSHLGDGGWQLHMGKIVNPYPTGAYDHPTLIMADGSTHSLFNRSGYSGQRITPEGWIYTLSGGVHKVTLTNGMVYSFDGNATGAWYVQHDGSQTLVVQCTKIEDVTGNNDIDISYSWVDGLPHYLSRLDSITFNEPGDYRTVQFSSVPSTNRIHSVDVKNGLTTLQHWEYAYSTDPQARQLQGDAITVYSYALTGVIPPEGDPWVLDYYPGPNPNPPYNQDATAVAVPAPGDGRYLLQKVTMPSGGSIEYTFAGVEFETGSQTCVAGYYPQFAAVQTRTVKDRDSSTIIGTWSYVYTNPGAENATTTVTVRDGSNATVQTEEKVFHGWGTYVAPDDSSMWMVGLTKSSTIRKKSAPSNDLEIIEETTTWQQAAAISGDTRLSSLWNSCVSNRRMTGITYVKPTTVTRVVTRTDGVPDGATYMTTSSSFDNWGNPGLITETGDVTRTTQIQYWQDDAHNIEVGRISARDPDPGGTECFKYDTYGRLSQRFVNPRPDDVASCSAATPSYARETRFSYNPDGNLYQQQVENGTYDVQTTYTNYAYGQAETTVVENGTSSQDLFFCKDVNPLGTVAWETDGRGTSCTSTTYRTCYGYDDLNRLTSITPPVTSPVTGLTTSFTYLPDWSKVTVTRGTYDIEYLFDGLGRLVEREDLKTLHKVLLDYDTFGTRRQAVMWYGANKADTLAYDAIGRITSITHVDNDSVGFVYDGPRRTRRRIRRSTSTRRSATRTTAGCGSSSTPTTRSLSTATTPPLACSASSMPRSPRATGPSPTTPTRPTTGAASSTARTTRRPATSTTSTTASAT